jgi:hypothetical protein
MKNLNCKLNDNMANGDRKMLPVMDGLNKSMKFFTEGDSRRKVESNPGPSDMKRL